MNKCSQTREFVRVIIFYFLIVSGYAQIWAGDVRLQVARQKTIKKVRGEHSPLCAYFSIVALGPVPARRYRVASSSLPNKHSEETSISEPQKSIPPVLLSPADGEVPPPCLYYAKKVMIHGKNKQTRWSRINLGFNQFTGVVRVPADESIVLSRKRKEGSDYVYENYLRLPALKSGSQSLVFLSPRGSEHHRGDKVCSRWMDSPKVSVLDLTSSPMLHKSGVMRNFSHQTIGYYWRGEQVEMLAPGQRRSFSIPENKRNNRIAVFIKTRAGRRLVLMEADVERDTKSFSVIATYDAHPKSNAGSPVGIFFSKIRLVRKSEATR